MMASYWWRLFLLALACFFFAHLVSSAAVALIAPRAVRIVERSRPSSAARTLFLLRMFPLVFSLVVVTAICIPSYLWLEPVAAEEQAGWICIVAASLTALLWLESAGRMLHATARSYRYMRRWLCEGNPQRLPEASSPAWVIPSDIPFLAIAGIIRPRLIASSGVLHALSSGQLASALRHEEAHRASRDNLKRLSLRCAPGIFPFVPVPRRIEQAWAKFAERAADDRAVSRDPARALFLAEALLRVARIQHPQSVLAASLLADRSQLHARVNRLLHPAPDPPARGFRPIPAAALAILLSVCFEPALLRLTHRLLEELIR